MSDRIDELVNDLTEETWNLYSLAGGAEFRDAQISHDDILATIRDLAAIAREAEARALTWQLTTKNTQGLLNEATTRAIEREKKYREAIADRDEWIDRCYQSDERADKAEAMCEWLAGLWAATDECPISIGGLDIEFECDDDPPCIPPIDEQRIARCWLAAARKAVANER